MLTSSSMAAFLAFVWFVILGRVMAMAPLWAAVITGPLVAAFLFLHAGFGGQPKALRGRIVVSPLRPPPRWS